MTESVSEIKVIESTVQEDVVNAVVSVSQVSATLNAATVEAEFSPSVVEAEVGETVVHAAVIGRQGPPGVDGDPGGPPGPQGEPGADGADGADGNTILYGTAAPTTEGVDGDFYIRTTTNFIYGPKAAGVWPAGVSLVGPQGSQGETGATGPTGVSTRVVGIAIDGGGSVPATGIKGYVVCPFGGTIIGWNIVGDVTGSAVVDVYKIAYGATLPTSSIAASAKPTLSSAKINKDSTVTGWTTTVTANDIFGFNLDSIATITKLNIEIVIQG